MRQLRTTSTHGGQTVTSVAGAIKTNNVDPDPSNNRQAVTPSSTRIGPAEFSTLVVKAAPFLRSDSEKGELCALPTVRLEPPDD